MAFAKALQSLGVDWGRTLPLSNFYATQLPEVKRLMDDAVDLKQPNFRLKGSEMAKIFKGAAPTNDGSSVETTDENHSEYGPGKIHASGLVLSAAGGRVLGTRLNENQ